MTALPFKRSITVGAWMFVASYLLTYLTFAVDALVLNRSGHELSVSHLLPLTPVISGRSQEIWQLVGWLLFDGLNVPLERTVDGESSAVEVLDGSFWSQFGVPQIVTPALYTVVPLAVIAVGSFLYVRRSDEPVAETTDAALLGASVLVGFAGLAAVAAYLVTVEQGDVSTGPVFVDAVLWSALFAGGAGAVGGAAALSLDGDDVRSDPSGEGEPR